MKLLIAGGGTGGHLYPGIAVAEAHLQKDPENQVLFVGTRGGLEAKILPKLGYSVEFISITGWVGKSIWKKIKTVLWIGIALIQSFRILFRYKPDFVLGVGGYASFPLLVCAFFLRKKSALQEQNVSPGITNRLLSKIVDKIFISFEESKRFFPPHKVFLTGNPIRKFKKGIEKKSDQFTFFIFGGSQGAHSLNRAFLDALPFLSDIKDKIHIIYQSGTTDLNWVESTCFQNGWKGQQPRIEVYDFIYDMDTIYSQADYVICRAGASSLSELCFLGKACLLIPYPHAAHHHQEVNARFLESERAARLLLDWQLDGPRLAKEMKWAYDHPRELEDMRKNIIRFSHPYAAQAIVEILSINGRKIIL